MRSFKEKNDIRKEPKELPLTKAKTKREAVVTALEDFNRRQRMAELVKYAGTFSDSFPPTTRWRQRIPPGRPAGFMATSPIVLYFLRHIPKARHKSAPVAVTESAGAA